MRSELQLAREGVVIKVLILVIEVEQETLQNFNMIPTGCLRRVYKSDRTRKWKVPLSANVLKSHEWEVVIFKIWDDQYRQTVI